MQVDAVADQLRRQEVSFDHLAGDEHARDHGNLAPGIELGDGERHPDEEAGQHPHIRDEWEQSRSQPYDEAELQPHQRQADGVKQAEQKADGELAPEEAGQRHVDQVRLLMDRREVLARQAWIDPLDDEVPVAQQIERDDGRDDEQRDDVERNLKAANERAEESDRELGHVAEMGLHELGNLGRAALFGEIAAGRIDERGSLALDRRDVARQVVQELDELSVQNGHQQRKDQHEGYEEQRRHEGRRPGARETGPFQPVADRIEQIGDGEAGDERKEDVAEEYEQEDQDTEENAPRDDLIADAHGRLSSSSPGADGGASPGSPGAPPGSKNFPVPESHCTR